MRSRLIAPVGIFILVAGIIAAGLLTGGDGGVRVQAGGPSLTDETTTTTQTPVTTSVSEAPTLAPTTAVVTTPPTEPVTSDPPTTVPPPPPPASPPTAAAALAPAEEPAPAQVMPDVVSAAPEATAVRTEQGKCVADEATCHPSTTPAYREPPDWAACPQWWELAQAVGWPADAMSTLDYVMKRESGCNPDAYNKSGATGLLQIIGGCAPYGGCREPEANLHRGLVMWQTRGWQPWQVCGFSRGCNGRG